LKTECSIPETLASIILINGKDLALEDYIAFLTDFLNELVADVIAVAHALGILANDGLLEVIKDIGHLLL
jgi:hypothetical protein